jgi:ectoine hydroxylase-related dioxygenase (phytanoyl-CoA dioxygenase family)
MEQAAKQAYLVGGEISMENQDYYRQQGFLIAEQLFDVQEIEDILKEAVEIFKGNRGDIPGITPVDQTASAQEILRQYTAIHFPHKISGVIRKFLSHPKVTDVLTRIISPNVKCMQSMLFIKGPGKKGQAWHQDEYYIPTRDRSLTGVWIAVDDANVENGCLWVIPGSQKDGYIRKRIPYHGQEYADIDVNDLSPYTDADAVPVEIRKGGVIFFNGYLLHSSLANKTEDRFRMALVNHYMSAESMLTWTMDGKLKDVEDMRDIVMVAGKDPYEYKGTEDLSVPFLRAENVDFKTQGKKTQK